MRIACFHGDDGLHAGIVEGDSVVDLGITDMPSLLAEGLDRLRPDSTGRRTIPLADLRLAAPVPNPPKFLAIGLNYAAHVAESTTEKPKAQLWFNKQTTCVIATGEGIHVPRVSDRVDYEGELAFVIGRRCRHVPADRAAEVIAGYTVVNDVSVRDWQRRSPTMTMGKSFDTHGPMGPWLVTPDEVGDPHSLRLRTWVNGELRQDASTSDLIFNCFAMVEHLSTAFTLLPGDVISTGTPAGVGHPDARYLLPGSTVEVRVEGVLTLINTIAADRP
jgi:2-keto-4-pentenoate hydratase/2-oxohepta-3-ene-1,7-dioic acid hydratase in catechol pathway